MRLRRLLWISRRMSFGRTARKSVGSDVSRMRGFRQWRWHLEQMYVKLNGEMVYLWRSVDQECEILESFVTMKRAKEADFSRGGLRRCVFVMNP